MKQPIPRWGFLLLLAWSSVTAPVAVVAAVGDPVLEGYADDDAYRRQLDTIAASPFVTLRPLAKTLSQRHVYLLEIGTGKRNEKPAVFIVGGVDARHLVGSELALRLASRLADEATGDKAVRKMLDRVTFYVIPRAAPDACEAFFQQPHAERVTNERPTDDDGDGRIDEDPPEDLNGDGLITMLRVEDASGAYILHSEDDRVLIRADAKKNERGRYRLYTEGSDNDGDEQINEDPAGGVAFNRNFTFRYPYFAAGAGPHQISEVETRAIADFAFDHPNIAVVLVCTPEDNLMKPWEPGPSEQSERIKTSLLSEDAPYFHHVAQLYRKIHGGENPPEPPEGQGSFSEWAYFHYGRWSFAFRGWWIPAVETENNGDHKEQDKNVKEDANEGQGKKDVSADRKDRKPLDAKSGEPDASEGDEKKGNEKRGVEELNALRWFAQEKIDGFVEWKRIEHPDFPGRSVELGGFKPFLLLNPPQSELEPLAEKHWEFVRQLTEMLPRLTIPSAKAESLGGGVWRITAVVVNKGDLPTMPQMGHTTRQPHPLQIELNYPSTVSLVTGHARRQLPVLAGEGGRAEQTWLVSASGSKPASLRVRAWSPSVGTATKRVELTEERPAGKKTKKRRKQAEKKSSSRKTGS